MDGNFSAEHMKSRSGGSDISLSAGMAFMANPVTYKAHLKSGCEIAQVNLIAFLVGMAKDKAAKYLQYI